MSYPNPNPKGAAPPIDPLAYRDGYDDGVAVAPNPLLWANAEYRRGYHDGLEHGWDD